MKTISSDVETIKYQVLGVQSNKLVNSLKQFNIPHF